jgi:membrane protease YdiL (CAAX protease family)
MKKQILIYSIIAYIVTWLIAFGIISLFEKGELSEYQLNLFHSFAAIGPTIGALVTTYLFYGKDGLLKLIDKIRFKMPTRKAIFFVLSPLLFFILGFFIYRLAKQDWYSFQNFIDINWSSYKVFLFWLLPLLTYSIFEEIGWRGFLLPILQQKYNAWIATIYLTVIWALWHIPFFFYRFDFSLGISIGFFFGIFVGSMILTSIYNSSKGFLIPVMLFHFLNNFCSEFDKEIIVAVLSTGFVFIAIYIYKKYGRINLSEIKRTKNYLKNENGYQQ